MFSDFTHTRRSCQGAALFLACPVLCRETQNVASRPGLLSAMKTLTWRGRGGRRRLCCRALASPPTYPTVNRRQHASVFTVRPHLSPITFRVVCLMDLQCLQVSPLTLLSGSVSVTGTRPRPHPHLPQYLNILYNLCA